MWPDSDRMREAGFGHLINIPYVIGGKAGYHDAASRYLSDRALLAWKPVNTKSNGRRPTRLSLSSYASCLVDFLNWCESTSRDWRTVDYASDIVRGYQAQMGHGLWSASGKSLAPQTIKMRVGEAVRFLQWSVARDLRKPFDACTTSQLSQAASRVHTDPAKLRLPTALEVARWLKVVNIEKGHSKALMCDLIIQTGIRREEVCQWRVDTLPLSRHDWNVNGDTVSVRLEYGTKGGKISDDGDERGPARYIEMPFAMAERLHRYRENNRLGNRSKFVKANSKTVAERRELIKANPPQLFLSDSNGSIIQSHTLYDAWAHVSWLPAEGWSPQGGRHFWACETLLNGLRRHAIATDWVKGYDQSIMVMMMALVIEPQLGHVSAGTAQQYFTWVHKACTQIDFKAEAQVALNDGWQALLDAEIP